MVFNQKLKPYAVLVIVTLAVILLQHYTSNWMYQRSFDLYPIYKGIDPDRVFMHYFLHHLMQIVMYLILIVVMKRLLQMRFSDFGFNFKNAKVSLQYSLFFILLWTLIQFGGGYLALLGGQQYNLNFIANKRNLTGYILFQGLLSGTSEEIFYRGFLVAVTLRMMQGYVKKTKNLYIITTIVSIVVFMAGHIDFTLVPFKITYIDVFQQLTTICVSIFYCITFFRTKSLLGPILMHNVLNCVVTFTVLLLNAISKG